MASDMNSVNDVLPNPDNALLPKASMEASFGEFCVHGVAEREVILMPLRTYKGC